MINNTSVSNYCRCITLFLLHALWFALCRLICLCSYVHVIVFDMFSVFFCWFRVLWVASRHFGYRIFFRSWYVFLVCFLFFLFISCSLVCFAPFGLVRVLFASCSMDWFMIFNLLRVLRLAVCLRLALCPFV